VCACLGRIGLRVAPARPGIDAEDRCVTSPMVGDPFSATHQHGSTAQLPTPLSHEPAWLESLREWLSINFGVQSALGATGATATCLALALEASAW
jgi:hypothetical protein